MLTQNTLQHWSSFPFGCSEFQSCVCVITQAKEKYEKAVDELSKCTPQYMENMEVVFDQCQQFEEKRLSFLREVLLDVKRHINLTENQRFVLLIKKLISRDINIT